MPGMAPQTTPRDANRREYYTITISSTTGSGVSQFRIPRPWLRLLAGLLAVTVVLLLASLIAFGHLLSRARSAEGLRQENEGLRRQLTQLAQIERRLAALDSTRVAMLRVVGVESPKIGVAAETGHEPRQDEPGGGYAALSPGPEPVLEECDAIRAALPREPIIGPYTRGFGPLREVGIFHTGSDIAGRTGASVVAAGEGIVSFVGSDRVFGNVLVIAHNPRLSTMYGHATRILVRVGDFVMAGQAVAEVGNTGRSSAPHLHFEVQWDGRSVDPGLVFAAWRNAGGPGEGDREPESVEHDGVRTDGNLGSR